MTNDEITFTVRGEGPETTVYFNPPIELSHQPHSLALVSFESYNKIYNVRDGINKFYYDEYVLSIPSGTYSVDDIHDYIQSMLTEQFENENSSNNNNYTFSLFVSNVTHKCVIESSFKIDFKSQPDSIGPLLGFSPRELEPNSRHESDQPITLFDDHHVSITCNIIKDLYSNQQTSHVLHDFIIAEEGGYSIREKPAVVLYHPVTVKHIDNITLRLVNKHNQLIHLDSHTYVAYKLHLKPV